MAASSAPYWGDLEGPKIDRTLSTKRQSNGNGFDEDEEYGKQSSHRASQYQPPPQPQPRQNRASTQSQAQTVSDHSPFASPTASSFRGDGLAPRPSSYQYGASSSHNRDYEKRRRRASRDQEAYYPAADNNDPLPSAPDPPRPGPPTSYRQPQINGGGAAGIQESSRASTSRRPNIAIDTNQGRPSTFVDADSIQSAREPRRPSDAYAALRGDKELGRSATLRDRGAVRTGSVSARKAQPDVFDPTSPVQARKASLADSEGGRRREWASDRSPLQRLELTLDSITKEEKRARVQEAEILARERSGQPDTRTQNSVRFRNRPLAKGPGSPEIYTPSPQGAGTLRDTGIDQGDSNRRTSANSRKAPLASLSPEEAVESPTSRDPPLTARQFEKTAEPQRGPSFRERTASSAIPVPVALAAAGAATGAAVSRSTSNKLKKEPPGDPWYNMRLEAEKNSREASRRKVSGESPREVATAGRSAHPGKESTAPESTSKTDKRQAVFHPLDTEDLDSDDNMNTAPVRRGGSNKLAQLTGERSIPSNQKSRSGQQQLYADRLDRSEELGANGDRAADTARIAKPVHGHSFAVAPEVAAGGYAQEKAPVGADGRHHFSNIFHDKERNKYQPGSGMYAPGKRLDEWKKARKATLSGALLDLDAPVVEQTEADKDKAWWEAGNKGKRRRSTSRQKADAYDGGTDNANGIVISDLTPAKHTLHPLHIPPDSKTWQQRADIVVPRARQYIGFQGTSRRQRKVDRRDKTWKIEEQSSDKRKRFGNLAVPGLKHSRSRFPLSSALSPYSPLCHYQSEHSIFHPFHTCTLSLQERTRLTPSTRYIRVPDSIAPTSFRPPLYLKCGPLLRYCGIKKETPPSRPGGRPRAVKELWRGTVMIATADVDSSYDIAPTLRLFVQPMSLLPPPPAQVDGNLDPEYVDPLAGLPKVGRDGKTLYVRPVEELEEEKDFSTIETDDGLFERTRSLPGQYDGSSAKVREPRQRFGQDGEKLGKHVEVQGFRLHAEHGVTFWRFNIEVELGAKAQRIAYRINRGPATGFWVPAKGESMNIMFHSCNGFSLSVNPDQFSGPDPMWRDVLNTHQTQPFHVMIGGGDQIYNDRVMKDTIEFAAWLGIKNPMHKHTAPFTPTMQQELELFYLNRYSMWFSQGLFGLANSQIPMVNIYDDHDIIDGFGSYPHHFMDSPVFTGLGAIAFKYYMLFQHQSVIDEGEESEPSWLLGRHPGPYIKELSRSVFMSMGQGITFLGLDCRTERSREEVITLETMDLIFDRCSDEIVKGETKHLIVLLGVPIAYPRLVWLENILTSRLMEPVKALGKAGLFGNLLNQFDGGVEILDDLDDHWTAKNHKKERLHLIQDLQDLAAEKSVRVTILGGDVHLAAIGQFYSNPKLGIPKDKDHRYMPNVISSAIVNTPPPEMMADVLNKRNKVHHMDHETDENMIPIFTQDVNGSSRNNKRLLPRRNWCSIRQYNPELSPPPTPTEEHSPSPPPRGGLLRRLSSNRGPSFRAEASNYPPASNGRSGGLLRRLSLTGRRSPTDDAGRRHSMEDRSRPPVSINNSQNTMQKPKRSLSLTRAFKPGGLFNRSPSTKKRSNNGGINGYDSESENEDDYSDDGYNEFQQHLAQRRGDGQPVQQQQSRGQQDHQHRLRMRGGAGSPSYFPEEDYDDVAPPSRNRSKLTKGKAPVQQRQQQPAREGARFDDRASESPRVAPSGPAIRNPQSDSRHTSQNQSLDRVGSQQPRPNAFHRTPTGLSQKQIKSGKNHNINLEGGLDICLNVEVSQKDPAGITVPYRLLVPALWYTEGEYENGSGNAANERGEKKEGGMKRLMSFGRKSSGKQSAFAAAHKEPVSRSGSERGSFEEGDDRGQMRQGDPVQARKQGKGFLAGRL